MNPHYKPEMVWWPSQVYNGILYTNKTVFLGNKGQGVVLCRSGLKLWVIVLGLLPDSGHAHAVVHPGII